MQKPNYFLILGIPDSADEAAVDGAFEHLSNNLKPSNFSDSPITLEQATKCMALVREAHTTLRDADLRKAHADQLQAAGEAYSPDQLKPFLGHVCVAAGIISYQELMDAVSKQTDIDLPLGQILQERRLITQTELEGMLMGQKLYGAPMRPLENMTKRLLSLGIITMDMVKIAVIDQRTQMASLDELMCKRGWISETLLNALK